MKRHVMAAVLAMVVAAVVGGMGGDGTSWSQVVVPAGTNATTRNDANRNMADVPVRRVVLFSSGVGFFQHSGKVTGNAATELRFKTDQINDILKSLVVSDTSNGTVKSITYGSQNPVARTLKSFQIDISSNPTLAGILNQIRGTKVALTLGDEKLEGTILGVEEKDRPVGTGTKSEDTKVVRVSYVNLITGTGIRSVQLDEVKRLEILDEALQKELDQALAALAQARDKDKKPVIVNFDGQGERPVSVGYLVETPVWKTSYRLILPDATSHDNGTLVGWAIVENQTDNDWNDVTLDLVGGRPISFIQDLYQPLYVPRPRVLPKTYASLTPQTYEEGLDALATDRVALAARSPAGVAQPQQQFGGGGGGGRGGARREDVAAAASVAGESMNKAMLADIPSDFAQGVQAIADATKIGEMFQYSVRGVTLPRQRSGMIPIITDAVPFDRVSIYNRGVLAKNALLGVRLKNQTKNYLLSGPLTVLDKVKKADGTIVESYAGDANVDDVPPGQERLLSYAVDQELTVDATKRDGDQRLMTGSIIRGVLHLKYTDRVTQTYLLENKSDHDKAVVVEHPIEPGFDLKDPPKSLEKTDKVYRFQIAAPSKKTGVFEVREERVRGEAIAILPMDIGALDFYSKSGEIPAKVKEVLTSAGEKRRVMVDIERKLQQREADRNRVLQEEGNIRENIRVLPSASKSYQDAIADLTAKDTELKLANKDIQDLHTAREKAQTDLEAYLVNMVVE